MGAGCAGGVVGDGEEEKGGTGLCNAFILVSISGGGISSTKIV